MFLIIAMTLAILIWRHGRLISVPSLIFWYLHKGFICPLWFSNSFINLRSCQATWNFSAIQSNVSLSLTVLYSELSPLLSLVLFSSLSLFSRRDLRGPCVSVSSSMVSSMHSFNLAFLLGLVTSSDSLSDWSLPSVLLCSERFLLLALFGIPSGNALR